MRRCAEWVRSYLSWAGYITRNRVMPIVLFLLLPLLFNYGEFAVIRFLSQTGSWKCHKRVDWLAAFRHTVCGFCDKRNLKLAQTITDMVSLWRAAAVQVCGRIGNTKTQKPKRPQVKTLKPKRSALAFIPEQISKHSKLKKPPEPWKDHRKKYCLRNKSGKY